MPTYLALAVALLLPGSAHPTPSPTQDRHIGSWTLKITNDAFAGRRSCQLFAHRLEYGRGALILHLPRTVDTSAAVYRIDGGEPVDTRSEQMEIARDGFTIDEDSLANPSGGLVRIPETRVLSGHTVQIEASAKGKIFLFRIDGLGAALDAARQAGCPPDGFIVQNTP